MTFEQLEYFIAVVEQDTLFDAAESLHISQSALSKQIIKLEKELGIQLLDRSRRSASLTEAGTLFYQEALDLYQRYHQTLSKMRSYQDDLHRELHIGTLPILTQYHLTSRFKRFTEQHPDIHIEIDEVEEKDLLNGLEQDKYDLIIAREHMIHPGGSEGFSCSGESIGPGESAGSGMSSGSGKSTDPCRAQKYKTYLLAEDELVAVLPTNHPLACQPLLTEHTKTSNLAPADGLAPSDNFAPSGISLKALTNERFILMNRYTSIYQLCMEEFKKAGIPASSVSRTARVESIISVVAIGEGISLLAKSNFDVFHHENVVAIPLNPSVQLPVILVRKKRKGLNPSMKEFLQFFVE